MLRYFLGRIYEKILEAIFGGASDGNLKEISRAIPREIPKTVGEIIERIPDGITLGIPVGIHEISPRRRRRLEGILSGLPEKNLRDDRNRRRIARIWEYLEELLNMGLVCKPRYSSSAMISN